MKKILFALILSITTWNSQAALTLKEVTNGTYSAERLWGARPLLDGESYARISPDGKRIIRHSFKTGAESGILFDVETARNVKLNRIDGYIMSPDESRILIQTETEPIYRRSFRAQYYIYDVANKTLAPLSKNGKQQVPLFSPDGTKIAFVRDNNLFLIKLLFNNSESQVTKDGKFNEVLNGIPDWVYEEEFSTARSFDFSADGEMLAWIRYDESKVPMFSFPLYEGANPSRKTYATYPGNYSYKYPVAGEQNSTVSVLTFDIKSRATRTMDIPLDADGYIPRIHFTSDPNQLAVVTLNRHQSRMDLYMVNPRSTVSKLVLREESDKYVCENAYTDLKFYDQNFLMVSDRDGYKHLYWYTLSGKLVKQLTSGPYEVASYYGYDAKEGKFYYASREEGPQYKAVYSIDLKGRKKKLSTQKGDNNALFSSSMAYYINTYSNATTPPVTTLYNNKGKELKVLIDNAQLKQKLNKAELGNKEFFQFTTSEGIQLNGWMIKPANFDPNRKYPVIMYQYSGPASQQVLDTWGMGFYGGGLYESYMAQQGFIFACVDGRGTGGRGAEFEKCTYLRLGDLESKDQVEAAIYLGSLPYVDKDNIAIWGWSFGGFNTLMSMSEGRPVFKAGVAVAAPSNWKYYDTVYTERYMRTPQENASGYDINPINRASKLHGSLLLMHGTADDNVHYRNAAEYSEALVQANKQFDMQIFTNRNHNISGGNTRYYLLTRMSDFFIEHLK